jgi:hypothetical protein
MLYLHNRSRLVSGDCVDLSYCPISGSKFFGRTRELDQIANSLDPAKGEKKRLLLWGLPGFGKTRVALRYRELFKHRYDAIIWVDASTLDSASDSFCQAAACIRARLPSLSSTLATLTVGDKDEAVFLVRRWLEHDCMNWLMVIDSIDEPDEFDSRKFLPDCNHGAVLATSSLSGLAKAWDMQSLEISEIDTQAGTELLLGLIGIQNLSDEGKCIISVNASSATDTDSCRPEGSGENCRSLRWCSIGN